MMDKQDKINLLLVLGKEVDEFYNEIVKYIPILLNDRYKVNNIEHSDTILSIIKADLPSLTKILYGIYDKYLTEEDIDLLIYLYQVNHRIDLNEKMFEIIDQAKDLWFNMLILKIDNVMDHIENGEFTN